MKILNKKKIVQTQIEKFSGISLENGCSLDSLEIAYETYGQLSKQKENAILICHPFSCNAHAAFYHKETSKSGWWDDYIGEGKAFDTNRYFVICSNVIGGCGGSSGPLSINPKTNQPYGSEFPFVSIGDMVTAQSKLIDFFEIETLYCVVGGSMGGMQALKWTVQYPKRVKNAIVIASTSEHSGMQIAYNEVGRQAILSDKNWENGSENSEKGLSIARMIGHISYISDERMKEKFGRKPPPTQSNILNTDFAISSYLIYQGKSFVDRFDAKSYIYLSKALDNFSLGKGQSLCKNLKDTKARYLLISFTSDFLYPTEQSKEIVSSLMRCKKEVSFLEINTPDGHDSFLMKNERQTRAITHFLN